MVKIINAKEIKKQNWLKRELTEIEKSTIIKREKRKIKKQKKSV